MHHFLKRKILRGMQSCLLSTHPNRANPWKQASTDDSTNKILVMAAFIAIFSLMNRGECFSHSYLFISVPHCGFWSSCHLIVRRIKLRCYFTSTELLCPFKLEKDLFFLVYHLISHQMITIEFSLILSFGA